MDCWNLQWVLETVTAAVVHDGRYNCIHFNIFTPPDKLTMAFMVNTILWKNGRDFHSRKNHKHIYSGPSLKKKKKSLSSLFVFLSSLQVKASYSFHLHIFLFSHTHWIAQGVLLDSSQASVHSRRKDILVLNKDSVYPPLYYRPGLNSQQSFPLLPAKLI